MARPLSDHRTHQNSSNPSKQKWVKFTDESQVHEIPPCSPPKPKRTRKAVEKRSCSAPNLDALKKQQASIVSSANGTEPDAKVETVDQGQRASMTSLEDLKKFDATKNLPPKEKNNLKQVN